MSQGIIKWFDNKKGFGFIAQDEGGQDVFVHFSVIGGEGFKTLDEGDRVEFEVTQSDKGLKALSVVKTVTQLIRYQAAWLGWSVRIAAGGGYSGQIRSVEVRGPRAPMPIVGMTPSQLAQFVGCDAAGST